MSLQVLSKSPRQTEELGRKLGRACRGDELILLEGELGTGKTLLTKGIFSYFTVPGEQVVSPTFSIMNRYQKASRKLFHIDVYRLGSRPPILRLPEIDDHLGEGIIVVEWAQYLASGYFTLPQSVRITLEYQGEEQRALTIRAGRRNFSIE